METELNKFIELLNIGLTKNPSFRRYSLDKQLSLIENDVSLLRIGTRDSEYDNDIDVLRSWSSNLLARLFYLFLRIGVI